MNRHSEGYHDPWKGKAPPTHAAPKLSPADRDAITERLAGVEQVNRELLYELAVQYGVSSNTIRRMKR